MINLHNHPNNIPSKEMTNYETVNAKVPAVMVEENENEENPGYHNTPPHASLESPNPKAFFP